MVPRHGSVCRPKGIYGSLLFYTWFIGMSILVFVVGTADIQLALIRKLRGLHPVFKLYLLHRYITVGDGLKPPIPINMDDEVIWVLREFHMGW